MKQEYKEKYEEARFNYSVSKSLKGNYSGSDNLISYITDGFGSSTKFQQILIPFEQQFPLKQIEINEFERRSKKLVQMDEYIFVWQMVECFKTCKGFEDIENSTSLSLSLMTSDFLKKD